MDQPVLIDHDSYTGQRGLVFATASPQDFAEWDAFTASHPHGTLYHQSAWKRLIEELFGHECYFLLARRFGQGIAGILPMVRQRSRLFGDYLVSMPYVNFGGVLADNASVAAALLVEGALHAQRLGCSHLESRDVIPQPVQWPCRTDKIVMQLALPESSEQLNHQLRTKLRAQIKRPLRSGAIAYVGGGELLRDFYTVFAVNMRDLGTPVYSRAFFASIAQTFAENIHIVIVRVGRRPVAGAFLLRTGTRMEIPWASSLRAYNHLSVNMMLYWEVLKLAIELDCELFDFGRTTPDSGAHKFKQQWGAQPRQLYWHYWLRDGSELPGLNPNNPKYALAIALWQRLPVWVSRIAGPLIVRNLP
ncbi:MAG: FemAB family PEP-CTERM system-associated protein [Gammaproteobacteria bacterium]|nr:FemAB family PEP-CTERM system-associated protein [Gammaproteobacteria bacterium]